MYAPAATCLDNKDQNLHLTAIVEHFNIVYLKYFIFVLIFWRSNIFLL